MAAGVVDQEAARLLERPGLLVGPLGGQRVEDIGHRDDAPDQRNRLAAQALRIAAAVELLVMAVRDDRGHAQQRRGAVAQDLVADGGVLAHDGHLPVVEPAGLEQDVVGRADLADVVHRRGAVQHVEHRLGQTELARDQPRVQRHAHQMQAGLGIAVFGRARQPQDGVVLALGDDAGGALDLLGQRRGPLGQRLLAAPQRKHVLGPCQELGPVDRLGQEVAGPARQRVVAHLGLVAGGDHQDRHVGLARMQAQLLDEGQAVDHRHHVVEQQQVEVVGQAPLQRRHRVGEIDAGHRRELACQRLQQRDVDPVVIDDDDLHASSGGRRRRDDTIRRTGERSVAAGADLSVTAAGSRWRG